MTNDEIMNKLAILVGQLSPENLYCDGEISHSQAMTKLKQIRKEWKALEKELGRTITEDEVLDWDIERITGLKK